MSSWWSFRGIPEQLEPALGEKRGQGDEQRAGAPQAWVQSSLLGGGRIHGKHFTPHESQITECFVTGINSTCNFLELDGAQPAYQMLLDTVFL